VVFVDACVMVSLADPKLPPLFVSPKYFALMKTVPELDVVIVMEHALLVRAHVLVARETTPVPVCDQVTFPVGKYPFNVAVQVTVACDAGAVSGLQETVV